MKVKWSRDKKYMKKGIKDRSSKMKVVYICIGSACHLKGAQDVINSFKVLIETYHLEDKLELKAAFCTGHCVQAVAVEKWDGEFLSLNKENTEQIFKERILPYL